MSRRSLVSFALALALGGCASPSPTVAPPPATTATSAAMPTTSPAVAATPAATSEATASEAPIEIPATGSFVYMAFPEGQMQVWASCADLSKAHQVPTPTGFDAGYGVWSPDGQRIAFNAGHDDPDVNDSLEPWDIYTMNRDGGDVVKLTNATALNGDPAWSPDGKLIAFDSSEKGREGIWVMDAADGGHKRRVAALPDGSRQDYAPSFSSDGKRLVFDREVDPDSDDDALWIVNLDGTDLHRLTPPGISPDKAEWSPDDSRIVFDAYKPGDEQTTIWIIDADGGHPTDLMPKGGTSDGYSKPTWSPDGSLILMTHGVHPGPSRLGLAVVRPDGSGLRWVNDGTGFEHLADWTATPC